MDRDLASMKKWLKNLGLEVDGKISDEELKKLVPPQRRDMWRNIIKHVQPKENVDLIKKSILLHKLQKRQKPLKAIVESESDLLNALKYEELLTKYNKIQKEIIDTKIENNKLKTDLNKKYEAKKNLIKNIELKQTSSYLAKQKIDYYDKFNEELNKFLNYCNHFSMDTNTNLTKTDYEDSLIKCFTEVDNAKENGTMNDGVNIGNKLCNSIYTTLSDKSPAILIQTIEENVTIQINNSNEKINETKEAIIYNDNEIDIDELLKKFSQLQLELHSKLTEALTEKENAMKNLKETTNLVKTEIISLYKLRNISCTDEEFTEFKKNLKNALNMVFKASIDCSKIVGLQENLKYEEETLNNILQETNIINEEIDEKKKIVNEMLKELEDKKSDFGLMELKVAMDKLAETYLTKIDNNNMIDKTISSIKHSSSCDINNINKLIIQSNPKSNVLNFWTLKNIKQHTEMVNFISEITTKFENFNNAISTECKFNEISKKENSRKLEFDTLITEIENKMLELSCVIEDSKTLADKLISNQLQNESSNE